MTILKFVGAAVVLVCSIIPLGCFRQSDQTEIQPAGRWEVVSERPFRATVPTGFEVYFFSNDYGVAFDGFGIQKTLDAGTTWSEIHTFFPETSISSVQFYRDRRGWAVGTRLDPENNRRFPVVFFTTNGGESWDALSFSTENFGKIRGEVHEYRDVCVTRSQQIWLATEGGVLKVAFDKNKLTVLETFELNDVSKLSCAVEDEGVWAAGRNGFVYHIDKTVSSERIGQNLEVREIKPIGENLWLLGQRTNSQIGVRSGFLMRSSDNGRTWVDVSPESKGLSDLSIEGRHGWLVGDSGEIFYTQDEGNTWVRYASPTTANLLRIVFLESGGVWISGNYHTVLRLNQ
ncbi:MAG: hypothetical protein IPN69_23130 [Acidobacteria bacterium]|nr:hypothetical protein [Acidobacteriota bacterium]